MSVHVPFRSFNRSQKSRVGGVTVGSTSGTWVNVDSPRIQRDLARHSAIGSLIVAGAPLGFSSDGYLTDGARVSKTAAGSLNLTVTQGFFTRANGATGSNAATTTLAVGAGGATGPRIDVVAIDTAGAAFVVVQGTAAGVVSANLHNRLSLVADLAANRIPVALVLVPQSAANLDAATVVELR